MCRSVDRGATAVEADAALVVRIDVLAFVREGVLELDFHSKETADVVFQTVEWQESVLQF